MYMRNKKYANYNIDDFPPNYSGQYSQDAVQTYADDSPGNFFGEDIHHSTAENSEKGAGDIRENKEVKEAEVKEEKKGGSLISSLLGFNKDKDGKKGGLLSGLFKGGDGKDGGILANIELEDLILIAVIFFLLKDGFEDDLILILGIILLSQ